MSVKIPEAWTANLPVTTCRECKQKKKCRYVDPYEGGLCLDCKPFDDDPMFTIRNWTPQQLLEFLEANDVVRMKIGDITFSPRPKDMN